MDIGVVECSSHLVDIPSLESFLIKFRKLTFVVHFSSFYLKKKTSKNFSHVEAHSSMIKSQWQAMFHIIALNGIVKTS